MSRLNFWILAFFINFFSTQNVNGARFARNADCDFLGNFQTLREFMMTIKNFWKIEIFPESCVFQQRWSRNIAHRYVRKCEKRAKSARINQTLILVDLRNSDRIVFTTSFQNKAKTLFGDIIRSKENHVFLKMEVKYTQCLKITQNVAFFQNLPKLTIFGIFNELLSTQNANVARFARKC